MLGMRKITALALAIAMVTGVAAQAATITPGTTNIDAPNAYDYQGVFQVGSGANTLTFGLDAIEALKLKGAVSTLQFTGSFTNINVSLDGVSVAGVCILGGAACGYQLAETAFNNGDFKNLVVSWDNVAGGIQTGVAQVNLQLKTAAVPVPAAGLLLLCALGGLGALRRRKVA
jgi:hypothetical protein